MTKKDYFKLADIIDRYTVKTPARDYIARDSFIDALCAIIKKDNPRFDRERFIIACK